jgi:hypothetical protein
VGARAKKAAKTGVNTITIAASSGVVEVHPFVRYARNRRGRSALATVQHVGQVRRLLLLLLCVGHFVGWSCPSSCSLVVAQTLTWVQWTRAPSRYTSHLRAHIMLLHGTPRTGSAMVRGLASERRDGLLWEWTGSGV